MLTLREVRNLVHTTTETIEKTPTARMLLDGASRILVKEAVSKDVDVTVYENGYVLYRVGTRCAVFPFPETSGYTYDSVKTGNVLQAEFFENENWYIRLIMDGEDQIADNQRKRDSKAQVLSYSAFEDDRGKDLEDKGQDILARIVGRDLVDEILNVMTEKQRVAVYSYYVDHMSQSEIAIMMGRTQQAVSALIRSGINALRKVYGTGYVF